FAFRVGKLFFNQHLEVCTDHLVAVRFRGLVVTGLRAVPEQITFPAHTREGHGFSRADRSLYVRGFSPRESGVSFAILLDLAEDPWIRRCHAADHRCVAASLRNHGAGIFGRANVAVSDDGNFYGIFHRGDPFPAGLAAITLLAGAGVESDRAKAAGL